MGDPASSAVAAGLSVSSPLHRLLGEYPAASADAGPYCGTQPLQHQKFQQQRIIMPKVCFGLGHSAEPVASPPAPIPSIIRSRTFQGVVLFS